jgi:glycosyltransferase involved in cell wall biosynthesis
MPVRNAIPYLDRAIESILGQTCRNFEFVILNDCSDDESGGVIREWSRRDKRIRVVEGRSSLGPVGSSNLVVAQSQAPIVARMDADDVAAPDRLQLQLDMLERHHDAVLVGSLWEGIDRRGRVVREADLSALFSNACAAPFAHGSIMFRRDAFEKAGRYRPAAQYWEDLDLYLRMARQGRILVIPRPLYQHRFSETTPRPTPRRRHVEEAVDLMFRCRAAYQAGESYDPLPRQPSGTNRLHPYVFLSLGFIQLWSGSRPRTVRRLLHRGSLGMNAPTVKALIWAIWADISPLSLRALMRVLLSRRNRRAIAQLGTAALCEWRAPIPPRERPEASPHFVPAAVADLA